MMKILLVLTGLLLPSVALAQSTAGYLAVPASGFTPKNSTTVKNPLAGRVEALGYTGNDSGTARFFGNNSVMFAPVNLPHGSAVISFECSGNAPRRNRRISFKLRRNEPQQANVDLATALTAFATTGYQSVRARSIASPVVNNQKYNYYIVADIEATNDVPDCPTCNVNRCTIGYETSV